MKFSDITSHEIACQVLGKDSKNVISLHDQQDDIANAINQMDGFKASFEDPQQRKYRPYFYVDASGFRFRDSGSDSSLSVPDVGSRLCMYFRSAEISEFFATKHLELHKKCFYNSFSKTTVMKFSEITSHAVACRVLDKDPDLSTTNDQKITDVCRAINQISGFKADFNNPKQIKWRAYDIVDSSGFRFRYSCYDGSDSDPGVGSRLCHYFASQAEADHFGKTFVELRKAHYYEY